jgi:hypothetical protein
LPSCNTGSPWETSTRSTDSYLGRVSARRPSQLDGGAPGWSPDSTKLIYPYGGTFYMRSIVTGSATPIGALPPSLIVSGPVAWQPHHPS